jgi:hypothetical protein
LKFGSHVFGRKYYASEKNWKLIMVVKRGQGGYFFSEYFGTKMIIFGNFQLIFGCFEFHFMELIFGLKYSLFHQFYRSPPRWN